jgi:exosome complex RNA-binding protein Csl4
MTRPSAVSTADTPPMRDHTVVNRVAQLSVEAFRSGDILLARRLSTVRDALNTLGLFSRTCPECRDRLTVDLDNQDDAGHCTNCQRRGE